MFFQVKHLLRIIFSVILFSQVIIASSYSKKNISFKYPSGWSINDGVDSDGWRSIAIESGKDTSIFIEISPVPLDMDLKSLSDSTYQNIQEQYKNTHRLENRTLKKLTTLINGKKVKGLRHKIDVKYQNKSAVMIGELYVIKLKNKTIIVQTEYWKRNLRHAQSKFNQIFKTLKF